MASPLSDPVSGPNSLHPDRMLPEARLAEIGRILAAGVMRRTPVKSSGLSAAGGDSLVDLPALKSGCRRRKRIRIGGPHEG
jgi:hypothetical protein